MKKIYIVRLTDDERETCLTVIKKLKGSSEKVRRRFIIPAALILNMSDRVLQTFFVFTEALGC